MFVKIKKYFKEKKDLRVEKQMSYKNTRAELILDNWLHVRNVSRSEFDNFNELEKAKIFVAIARIK